MTSGGWLTFILSITTVTSLFAWCVYKVLSSSKKQKMMGENLFDESKNRK